MDGVGMYVRVYYGCACGANRGHGPWGDPAHEQLNDQDHEAETIGMRMGRGPVPELKVGIIFGFG